MERDPKGLRIPNLKKSSFFSQIYPNSSFVYLRNGKCENTLGSFRCLCDDGYSLPGRSNSTLCADDDECQLGLHHCHPDAECANTEGSYECACAEGFVGDGFECQVTEALIQFITDIILYIIYY